MTLPIDNDAEPFKGCVVLASLVRNGTEVRHIFSPGRSGTVIAVHDTSPTATVMWSDGFSSCSLLSVLRRLHRAMPDPRHPSNGEAS